jgi:hypothetical protein
MTTTASLLSLLQALATGEAEDAMEDQYDANYPASVDSTGLIQSEDN